jgi:hypothetical protein
MNVILPYIKEWFLQKEEHFVAFSEADSRVEGWFKAELLVLLSRLVRQGHLDGFERETKIISPKDTRRKQIDFRVRIQGEIHLCELKAICISQAAGTPRNLHFYFRDDNVGIIKDFKKLYELPGQNKWVLAFIYPSPELKEWHKAISSLPSAIKHWQPVTRPQDFPEFLFLALWKA